MQELRRDYPVEGLLRVAGLARSTFYHQQRRLNVADKYAALKIEIKRLFHRHKGRYGYRRITAALRRLGTLVNRKLIQRLMGVLGLKSLLRPKKYRSYKGEVGSTAPNILQRGFNAKLPNQKWVTDVTEFNVRGEKLYLSPVMDLFNAEIIAYKTSKSSLDVVDQMLLQALRRLRRKDNPILHSDQGWQYRMRGYQQRLREHGVIQSMSRRGNCLDNAAMESFFGTLKAEFLHLKRFQSIDELRKELHAYIRYYNNERIALRLDGLSPIEYRKRAWNHLVVS